MMKNKKKHINIDYARPKRAFDEVIACYTADTGRPELVLPDTDERAAYRIQHRARIASEWEHKIAFYIVPRAKKLSKGAKRPKSQAGVAPKGRAVKNPQAPNLIDQKVDIEHIILTVITNPCHLAQFVERYILGDEKLTKAEQHVFAMYEQRIGRLFIERRLWPVRSYFNLIREGRTK